MASMCPNLLDGILLNLIFWCGAEGYVSDLPDACWFTVSVLRVWCGWLKVS